ncbi:MAG: hypothetical protein ABFR97_04180, partial [Thermodesulfobacteriota bacterium]
VWIKFYSLEENRVLWAWSEFTGSAVIVHFLCLPLCPQGAKKTNQPDGLTVQRKKGHPSHLALRASFAPRKRWWDFENSRSLYPLEGCSDNSKSLSPSSPERKADGKGVN